MIEKLDENLTNGIALFGAGQNGVWCLDYLLKNDFKVSYFIDNSKDRQGTYIKGVPVISYGEFLNKNINLPILITAKHAVIQIQNLLKDYPLKISFDAWFYHKNKKDYDRVRNLLYDEKSKIVLDNIIKTMQTGNENYCAEIAETNQYFCVPHFFNTGNEVFVDLGAYVGDTIEKFIQSQNGGFRHIYAFEIGNKQLQACKKRIKRLIDEWALHENSITLENMGIGINEETLYLKESQSLLSTTLENNIDNGDKTSVVNITTVNKYFKNIPISFIKADIEGSEIDMLKGATEIIKRDNPKLALSVYHRPDDLINSVEILHKLNSDYKFILRHHSALLMETTLYCWVK